MTEEEAAAAAEKKTHKTQKFKPCDIDVYIQHTACVFTILH